MVRWFKVSGVKSRMSIVSHRLTRDITVFLSSLSKNVDDNIVSGTFNTEVNVHYVVWNIFVMLWREVGHVEVGVVSTSTGLLPLDFRETSAALMELV